MKIIVSNQGNRPSYRSTWEWPDLSNIPTLVIMIAIVFLKNG